MMEGGDRVGELFPLCPHCKKPLKISLRFGSAGSEEIDLWVSVNRGDETPENAGEEKRDSWPHA